MAKGATKPTTKEAAQAAGVGAAGGAVGYGIVEGLQTAAAKAGPVLRSIFGGLPWNMDPSSIIDAVVGGVSGVGVILPSLL